MGTPARRQGHLLFPEFADWFESFPPVLNWRSGAEPQGMRIEDYVEGDHYVVRAELPGIDPDKDVEITVHDGVLTIHAERAERKEDKGRSEFRYGSLARSVRLPGGVRDDTVTASYTDGILTVRAALGEDKHAARRIAITRPA